MKQELVTNLLGHRVCKKSNLEHCWKLPNPSGKIVAVWLDEAYAVKIQVVDYNGESAEMWLTHVLIKEEEFGEAVDTITHGRKI